MDSESPTSDLKHDRSRLRILEEKIASLRRKRDVAEDLRKHNCKAIEMEDDPDRKEDQIRSAEERYEKEVAEIDAGLAKTKKRIEELRSRVELQSGRILLVDDEKNIRLTVSQALKPLGMPIDTAADGEEALAKLSEEDFTLLLLDLKMPRIDGMAVLDEVQKRWPKIKVIILTAHGTIDIAVETMKLGAVEFIQKPFSLQEIRDLVKQVLGR